MQTSGSLEQTGLSTLLETMQSERATGTLSVNHDGATCSLYFLFGHLFHAAGGAVQGEEAVIDALGWRAGSFTFDPRAKLPAEETIKSSTADLLAEADRRGADGADSPSRTPTPSAFADMATTVEEPAFPGTGAVAGAPAAPAGGSSSPAPSTPPAGAGDSSTGASAGASGGPGAAWPTSSRPAATPAPAPADTAPAARREDAGSPAPIAARRTEPTPEPAVFGNPSAPPISELYPLPSGKAIYEGLKSAFVDFPKLLRTLDTDKHTGYVRLDGEGFSGVLLLHDGHVLEALHSEGTKIAQGVEAFQGLRRRMEAGQGLLDVIDLAGEIVVALAQLLTARPLFTGLLGRFINFDSLLEYLSEEKVDGSMVVTGGAEMGVILFRKGAILGSYTASNRDLSKEAGAITTLATERTSRIEVKSGSSAPQGIDVEAALRTAV